jgi:hypothetical protein
MTRDAVLSLLTRWERALSRQWKGQLTEDEPDHDLLLDRHLVGVVLFLKSVAEETADKELLDRCVGLELKFREPGELVEAARQMCVRYFFREPLFRVDMSKHHAIVEQHAADVDDVDELRKLRNYVDEDRKLREVYEAVKARLSQPLYRAGFDPDVRPLTLDNLKRAVEEEIAEVHRRAEKHIAAKLAKVIAEQPPSRA